MRNNKRLSAAIYQKYLDKVAKYAAKKNISNHAARRELGISNGSYYSWKKYVAESAAAVVKTYDVKTKTKSVPKAKASLKIIVMSGSAAEVSDALRGLQW